MKVTSSNGCVDTFFDRVRFVATWHLNLRCRCSTCACTCTCLYPASAFTTPQWSVDVSEAFTRSFVEGTLLLCGQSSHVPHIWVIFSPFAVHSLSCHPSTASTPSILLHSTLYTLSLPLRLSPLLSRSSFALLSSPLPASSSLAAPHSLFWLAPRLFFASPPSSHRHQAPSKVSSAFDDSLSLLVITRSRDQLGGNRLFLIVPTIQTE